MHHRTNRREFLRQSALAGVGIWVGGRAGAQSRSANEKLNIACVGVGGRGAANLKGISSENVVLLCDIDDTHLAKAAQDFPRAERLNDWRRALERPGIDAVVVSTPDHNHAVIANAAMRLGKHVYREKPLTHSIDEARVLTETARRTRVATQMGNGGHSSETTRRVVELIQTGAVGAVREVHCWTDRPIWPQGIDRPADTPPVPASVHWDLWLGPARERPYNPAYHPFKWRGWWDFGTGALGDMACHIMDAAFWALKLGAPASVEAEAPPTHQETAPQWSVIRY